MKCSDFYNAIDGSYCNFSAYNETGNCVTPDCLDPYYPDPAEGGYKGDLMCGVYEPTNVISISYSGAEVDLPYSYLERQCAEVMKLGLQGITVVTSSGDDGVGSFEGDPTPNGCLGPQANVFNPEFSSDCPYMLSVGATEWRRNLADPNATNFTEVGVTDFSSGGGFSNVFATPDWQKSHVETYLNVTGPKLGFDGYEGGGANYSNATAGDVGVFNKLGRGIPDVSAVGDNIRVSVGGLWGHLGGTSAASPLIASVLNLINEERLAANKSTIGFIHQVIVSASTLCLLIPGPH